MLLITDGLPRGLGYMDQDDRASGFGRLECDTYTCTHCTSVVVLHPLRKRERYKCKGCNHHICDNCAAQMATGAPCRTWNQFVDESLEREARQLPNQPIIMPWDTRKD